MEVEIASYVHVKTYLFEGEPNIADVKFNTLQTAKIYELITNAKSKEAVVNISKAIFQYFPELLSLSSAESSAKSVCAKIVSRGETIVECLNCRMDESCIICLNCFKNGNHEGHKVLYKKAYGGCCDCGDAEAWSPEGFCKQHSGEAQDIKIQPAAVKAFSSIMEDLSYLYFRLKLKKQNQNVEKITLISLINVFERIIENGPKGIKLLALFLQSQLPMNLKYNELLQSQSVIFQLFTWHFIGNDLKFWEPVFIKMFPYYEFKKVLLATYIECFPQLYASQEACMLGQSLSCQILTSYKLVQDYIDGPNSQPIGYNLKGDIGSEHMNYLTSMLCTDLQKIIKLQEPVPEKYIRLQVSKGMSIMFASNDILNKEMAKEKQVVGIANKKAQQETVSKKKKKKKKKKKLTEEETHQAFFNPIFFMIRNVKQIFNQFTSLQLLNSLLRAISKDRLSLMKALKQFAGLIDTTSEELVIFRPYDRAFALTIFTLCNENLDRLLEFQFRRDLMELLEKDEESFQVWLNKLEQRMLSTYFFYPHVLCNEDRGYHSSFFNYIYLYRSKDNFLISIDTLQLKITALLRKTHPVLDFCKLMRFQDLDDEKWSPFILDSLYQELQLLYIGYFSQIYVSHYEITKKDNKAIRNDVVNYLAKFLVGEGNSATLERAVQFSKAFLFDNNDYLKKCLVHCCNYLKDRKIFELKQQFRQQKPINYKDFELRLKDDKFTNKNIEQSRPQLTHSLINGYNRVIFSHYWNDENIETIKQVMLELYEQACKSQVHDNIIELANIICKFCSNMRAFATPDQQAFADQILLRAAFSPQIKQKLTQYKEMIGEEEVQTDVKLKQKKQLLMLKKMKKMEGIKKKQEENMSTIREVHKMQEETHETEEFCAICRSKDNKRYQLVYLVSLNIRNLEKLANLGAGVQTASFTTCYHIFHYACLQKQCKSLYEADLKCPVCRQAGNLFFPAYPLENQQKSHPYVMACIERVTHIMMTIHSYLQIDPIQELLKSFYHFALLSQFNVEYLRKSRLKLYRAILDLFSHFQVRRSFPDLVKKFASNDISLNPKLLKKDKVNIIYLKAGEEDLIDGDSDSEFEDEQNESLVMIQVHPKKIKSIKKTVSKDKKKNESIPAIFQFVGLRILTHILQNAYEQMKAQKPTINIRQEGQSEQKIIAVKQHSQEMLFSQNLPQVPLQIQLAIQQLFGAPTSVKPQQLKFLELSFIKMPPTFHWDMSKNDCDLCRQPCHDLFVCLLCPWKGCINCKPGGVNKHYPAVHGETSAFMRVNDGVLYIIGNKMIKKMGCLYLNEWGEPLRLKNDWNSYYLQQDVLEKTKSMLLRDE